ncbi:uncharacterized protein DDB_G0283697-like [Arabidopsis lyrata subsp. lyrata]|uniref:uncharacterized protein DDB_G0283697-like n=1 Tax=Arabidopsis lyrata subsp. lyrata TaxID=81972 RepID=UPI000A29A769|nr:uncharacterized protein DDB_G0283697-like [Arabidopsis lyrata subsp. lyrata]|eukprot:XP_020883425.1 uncharacterized protein DDB_G0283697-like [Arabidopsis lyrata subsp. lyrata]
MESRDSYDLRSIDLESQRVIDFANAEHERQTFNGAEASKSRRKPSIEIEDDDDVDREKSPPQKKRSKSHERSKPSRKPSIEIDGDDVDKETSPPQKKRRQSRDDNDEDGDDEGDDDGDDGKSSPKKKRRQYSDVWEHFTVITKKDKKGEKEERAMCKHCKNDYAYNPYKNGTNSYRRHLEVCKLRIRSGDIGKMMINSEARLQARKTLSMITFSLV